MSNEQRDFYAEAKEIRTQLLELMERYGGLKIASIRVDLDLAQRQVEAIKEIEGIELVLKQPYKNMQWWYNDDFEYAYPVDPPTIGQVLASYSIWLQKRLEEQQNLSTC